MWAAGNGGQYGDSCAADGYINSIYTIGVGAANNNGLPAYYDEQCSAKMIVTFNQNARHNFSSHVVSGRKSSQMLYATSPQVTTTLDGQCEEQFAGTSASTPLVAGVIALALQAK